MRGRQFPSCIATLMERSRNECRDCTAVDSTLALVEPGELIKLTKSKQSLSPDCSGLLFVSSEECIKIRCFVAYCAVLRPQVSLFGVYTKWDSLSNDAFRGVGLHCVAGIYYRAGMQAETLLFPRRMSGRRRVMPLHYAAWR